jgi:hypothetical protein
MNPGLKLKGKEQERKISEGGPRRGRSRGTLLIRSELNLEKWAILFATSKLKARSREVFRTVPTGRVGVVIGKQRDDRGNVIEVGILRVSDLKVFYGLIRLWELAGKPPDEPVCAGFRELSRILKRQWGGEEYLQLRLALERLRRIPIDWIGSFYQRETDTYEEYVSQTNILSVLELYKRERAADLQAGFAFKFHDRLLSNLLNNHTKPLNLDVILSFKKELSILLYCHIDLVLADKERYERRTKELFEDLAIEGVKYKYPSARKQNLEPVLRELEGARLSTGILEEARLERTAERDDYKAIFVKRPFKPALPSTKPSSEVQSLVSYMLEVLEDKQSEAFYYKVAMNCPSELIYKCLSEVKDEWLQGRVRRSKGALFTDKIKRYCLEKGIDLGLRHAERSSGSNP